MARARRILVEISAGELIDKITILQIKAERITEPDKLRNVRAELEILEQARDQTIGVSPELEELSKRLKQVNESLWDLEDAVRRCERASDFGPDFIALARSIYRENDKRAALKREINSRLGSRLVEEKSYPSY